jgi:hypothetical protein
MPVLVIGQAEQQRIAEMIAAAKAHPVSMQTLRAAAAPDTNVLKLEDRKPGTERPPSDHIIFPGGYRAAFSIEQQPSGFCNHLSISVMGRAKKGMTPSPEAVTMIAEAFGMSYPADHMWLEEFERGEFAVNLLSLIKPNTTGAST